MEKIDLSKMHRALYATTQKARSPHLVEVPRLQYLMLDGTGDPNTSPDFQPIMEALYGLSYTLKFKSKLAGGPDWKVMTLEGLWWAPGGKDFENLPKAQWLWTLMMAQPDVVKKMAFDEAVGEMKEKKPNPFLEKVRLEALEEGSCVQALHIGPYSEEGPLILAMHEFARQEGYRLHGKHHEIYMSDPRRAAPEKWKTILRQPIRRG